MDHYLHMNNYNYNPYHQDVKNKKRKQANKQPNKKEKKSSLS